MSIKIKKHILPVAMVLGAILSLSHARFEAPKFVTPTVVAVTNQQASYQQHDASTELTHMVHSATAVALPNGNLLAMWYGGSREGHTDVKIYSSLFDQQQQQWQAPKAILDRMQVSNDLDRYVKKVGNPVLIRHPQGPLVLVYVSVSLAGWATSQINMMLSYDDGQTWHPSKHLVTSPFINISTLVKNDAVIYEDGTIGITAYHELLGEFSEIVRVTLDGQVINKYRMSAGDKTIQPTVATYSATEAVTFMRDTGKDVQKVRRSVTDDGGLTWSAYETTQLDNLSSAIFTFTGHKGRSWMVYNDAPKGQEHGRNTLALAVSDDKGINWKTVHHFERIETPEVKESKFAYPWVARGFDGQFHLFYTWNRKIIKHIAFNQAWLEGKA